MASTGIDVKSLLPIPDNTEAVLNNQDGDTSNTLADPPTGKFAPDRDRTGNRLPYPP